MRIRRYSANRHADNWRACPHSHAHSCAAHAHGGAATQTVAQPTQSTGSSSSGLPFSDDFTDSSTGWANGSYNGGSIGYGKGYYSLKLPQGATFCTCAAPLNSGIRRGISVDSVQYDAPSDNIPPLASFAACKTTLPATGTTSG